MFEDGAPNRRGFLRQAGGIAGAMTAARAQSGPSTPFGPVKQVEAGPLNVGYVEQGPADGRAVILLHGWPYDIHSYAEVVPLLAQAGYRVIVPHLRGSGTTAFCPRRPCEMRSNRQLR